MLDNVFSYCSWLENDIASNVIDFVDSHKHFPIQKSRVDEFFRRNHIDYNELPKYLKDKIDELNVYN